MSTKTALTLMAGANRLAANLSRNAQLRNVSVVSAASLTRMWRRNYSSEKTAAERDSQSDTEAAAAAGTATPAGDSAEVAKKLAQENDTLSKELKTLKEKNDELLDKYKRSLAESENLRVRLTKQIADAKIFGIQGFCKDLLEVADTLGHATQAVPQEQVTDSNPHLKSLYQGLVMTKASLLQVFKRHGLEPMDPLNEKFNPNFHEALFQKEDTTVEPNTVVEVTKLGYKLHERCIRPALVGVSKS